MRTIRGRACVRLAAAAPIVSGAAQAAESGPLEPIQRVAALTLRGFADPPRELLAPASTASAQKYCEFSKMLSW